MIRCGKWNRQNESIITGGGGGGTHFRSNAINKAGREEWMKISGQSRIWRRVGKTSVAEQCWAKDRSTADKKQQWQKNERRTKAERGEERENRRRGEECDKQDGKYSIVRTRRERKQNQK